MHTYKGFMVVVQEKRFPLIGSRAKFLLYQSSESMVNYGFLESKIICSEKLENLIPPIFPASRRPSLEPRNTNFDLISTYFLTQTLSGLNAGLGTGRPAFISFNQRLRSPDSSFSRAGSLCARLFLSPGSDTRSYNSSRSPGK